MVEKSCTSLVNASTLCAMEDEAKGENAVSALAEISTELQRERQRNAELMEKISVLEARILERDSRPDSLLACGQASFQNTIDSKAKRQRVATNTQKKEEDVSKELEMKHSNTYVPIGGMNVGNGLVNWMNIEDTESLHSEVLKESDSAADCDDTDDSDDEDDEDIGENEICTNQCLISSSNGHDEPKDLPLSQECKECFLEKGSNLSAKHQSKEIYVAGGYQKVGNVTSHQKHPKLAFCPKEVKRIVESEEFFLKNAQSHTMRKIIVFASLGIRHGCEDMYELDFNHFSILRKGEPYVSSKDPGEHVLYENPGVRRKIFYPNRQNPTLCPVQILEEEKAMRPSDSSCPSYLFLCIKYGGRTRNIPQNEYVRQRMGRNKLKSFGPAICRMAMLVNIRSGSFFFKALGITLLFMAGFPDDLVQRETKYRSLDLLQKYYRTDEDAEGEELFLSHSAINETDISPISLQLMGKKMSAKSKSRRHTKAVRKAQEKASNLQSAPSNSGPPAKFEVSRNDSIQTQAITPANYIISQAQADTSGPNTLMTTSINCSIPNSNQQSSYPIFPHPASSFVPIIYWPPPNAFIPCPQPPPQGYQYPIPANYVSSYLQPYYSNPLCDTLIPKPLKDSWKDDAAASEAENGSKSSSSSTEP